MAHLPERGRTSSRRTRSPRKASGGLIISGCGRQTHLIGPQGKPVFAFAKVDRHPAGRPVDRCLSPGCGDPFQGRSRCGDHNAWPPTACSRAGHPRRDPGCERLQSRAAQAFDRHRPGRSGRDLAITSCSGFRPSSPTASSFRSCATASWAAVYRSPLRPASCGSKITRSLRGAGPGIRSGRGKQGCRRPVDHAKGGSAESTRSAVAPRTVTAGIRAGDHLAQPDRRDGGQRHRHRSELAGRPASSATWST